jgi:DNA-binding transcriptional LysR family regulator
MPDTTSPGNPPSGGDLAAFVAAVDTGSVQGAANALQLTQSAATKRIQALERRLGGTLLERGRFGARPTALGRLIYLPAKQALAQLESVNQAAAAAHAGASVTLRLSASHTIGEFLLPDWLSQFCAAQPDVHPQLEVVNSQGVLDAIRGGRSEIGFVEGLDKLDSLESLTVARDELVVVVATAHRWARRKSIAAHELPSQTYLSREPASGTRAVAAAALRAAGVELTPALQAASAESLKRALAAGGFTLMSRLAISAEQRAGTLAGIPIRELDLGRELRAVRRRRPAATAAARSFWRWLTQRATQNTAPSAT